MFFNEKLWSQINRNYSFVFVIYYFLRSLRRFLETWLVHQPWNKSIDGAIGVSQSIVAQLRNRGVINVSYVALNYSLTILLYCRRNSFFFLQNSIWPSRIYISGSQTMHYGHGRTVSLDKQPSLPMAMLNNTSPGVFRSHLSKELYRRWSD